MLDVKIKQVVSAVKTADGADQRVIGYVDAPVSYNNTTKLVRLYLIPSLSQDLYLGIDFWNIFGIKPTVVSEIDVCTQDQEIESEPPNPSVHPLSAKQLHALQQAIELLPSSEVEGLGKTDVLRHTINTNNATPVKQRHYPVSPAVQKEMYSELDRMLSLGVIEESNSPWNSPIVMVRKHCGKARLCLDSRAINNVTVKDAYPLPIIDGILSRLGETY